MIWALALYSILSTGQGIIETFTFDHWEHCIIFRDEMVRARDNVVILENCYAQER